MDHFTKVPVFHSKKGACYACFPSLFKWKNLAIDSCPHIYETFNRKPYPFFSIVEGFTTPHMWIQKWCMEFLTPKYSTIILITISKVYTIFLKWRVIKLGISYCMAFRFKKMTIFTSGLGIPNGNPDVRIPSGNLTWFGKPTICRSFYQGNP